VSKKYKKSPIGQNIGNDFVVKNDGRSEKSFIFINAFFAITARARSIN